MSQYRALIVGVLGVVLLAAYFLTGERAPPEQRSYARWWEIGATDPRNDPIRERRREVPAKAEFPEAFKRVILGQASDELAELDKELAEMLTRGNIEFVRERLLRLTARASELGERVTVARALSLLGQLSVESQDFDAAEVYFEEALDIYHAHGDEIGIAQVHMNLGKMHLKLRQRARIAGKAYDRLLLARWQLSQGRYGAAEANLRLVVDENLAIHRFGAAASAYKSLMRLYAETGFQTEFELAAGEAASLYAASGQLHDAEWLIEVLSDSGVDEWRLVAIEHQIDADYAEFVANTRQIAVAEDYQRLFRHYRALGNDERAWSLRVRADESLRQVAKRAMYRRTPDALAVLYASMNDIERAHEYFALASRTFAEAGRPDLTEKTERLVRELR